MLIKEYRIPLPMSVEEYRIAQLYMIQKKSRLDSTGEGSGVEIIENRPYKDGPGGAGQYTKKIYHIGNHIPGWLKAIVPKSALQVIEEAWNAYPYTKMRTTCPFVEKFYVDVETKYLPDGGSTENVFNLPPEELSNQTTDLIDPIKDPIPSNQYSKEEDPLLYVSKKTNRGPLTLDWLQKPQTSIMCAYKRITVEFKYWGMQSKIEQFIHDGLRRPMLMGHRQAWVWQDEWCGLTISDIRELEKETQRMLAKKMGKVSNLNLSRRISDGDKGANELSKTDTIPGSTIELLSQEALETGSATSSDSDEEFFDAQAAFDSDQSEDEYNEMFLSGTTTFDQNSHSGESVESLDSYLDENGQPLPKKALGKTVSVGSSISMTSSADQLQVLVLVVHGGNPLEMSNDIKSKENDFDRLVCEFDNVMQNHYKDGLGRIAFRLVECPYVFKDALPALKDITPQLMDEYGTEYQGSSLPSFNFPVSSLPILTACSSSFDEMVDGTITKANNVYRDFLNSEAGAGFNGEVCIIGDCNGGLLAYEALCRQWFQHSFDTDSNYSASNPVSPISNRMKSPLGDIRHTSDPTPGKHLSSSDVDIRSTISEVDYGTGFNDFAESLEGSTDSVSTEEGLDRAQAESQFLPFKSVNKLEFETSKFFAFGSPIGLVSLYKKFSAFEVKKGPPVKPVCGQFYNLFHPSDPLSSRIEPLIVPKFSQIPAVSVPRYQRSPLGDGVNNSVTACINSRGDLFSEKTQYGVKKKVERTGSNMSTSSGFSGEMCDSSVSEETRQGVQKWWGNDRLDYALFNPKGLQQIPLPVLCPLLHISYWESKDVVAFLIRQILDISGNEMDCSGYARRERRLSTFHSPSKLDKWQKKRTSYKIKNLAANHRANDAIAVEGSNQIIAARFTYGPLDVAALTGEKVDIYIMCYPPAGEWNMIDTVITGSGGRASFTVPEARRLDVGIYPVKMVVRGDHTTVDCNLAVLPPQTEAVVFSIDGAFSASVSIRGRHAKVQPGAVDVVRHWQDQGYLIIYVTSRPDFQKDQVMLWMAEHNFPFGVVSFCGSLSTVDIQRHKTEYLRNLTKNMKVTIHAAYGSAKDVTVYCEVGVEPNAIFVIGRNSSRRSQKHVRKQLTTATHLSDGYASHLTTLANHSISRPATGNSRITLRRGCFGLPKKHKHHSKNTSSIN